MKIDEQVMAILVGDTTELVDTAEIQEIKPMHEKGDYVIIHGFDTCKFLGEVDNITDTEITITLTHEFSEYDKALKELEVLETPKTTVYELNDYHIVPIRKYLSELMDIILDRTKLINKLTHAAGLDADEISDALEDKAEVINDATSKED